MQLLLANLCFQSSSPLTKTEVLLQTGQVRRPGVLERGIEHYSFAKAVFRKTHVEALMREDDRQGICCSERSYSVVKSQPLFLEEGLQKTLSHRKDGTEKNPFSLLQCPFWLFDEEVSFTLAHLRTETLNKNHFEPKPDVTAPGFAK